MNEVWRRLRRSLGLHMALLFLLALGGLWLEENWLMRVKDEKGGWHLSPTGEFRAMANYRRDRITRQGKDVRVVVQARRHSEDWYDLTDYEVALPFFENWMAFLEVEWTDTCHLRVGYYRMVDFTPPLEFERRSYVEVSLQ